MQEIKMSIPNFDIRQIAASGQCFRINPHPEEPDTFTVIAYGRYLKIRQKAGSREVSFFCSADDFKNLWWDYFDIGTDYAGIIQSIDPEDQYLTAAAQKGSGIRILRQQLWEVMVSFIISQNNNIPRIKHCIELLCELCGTSWQEDGRTVYAFPDAKRLYLTDLSPAKLGYREKYIKTLAENVWKGKEDLSELIFSRSPYSYVENRLKSIYGVGPKVANCIMLFGLHRLESFPVDTWMHKIIEEKYNGVFPVERYRDYAGVIQQYIFNYAINESD